MVLNTLSHLLMCMFKVGIITPTLQNNKTEVQKVTKQLVQVHRISGISGLAGILAQVCLNPISRVLSIMC